MNEPSLPNDVVTRGEDTARERQTSEGFTITDFAFDARLRQRFLDVEERIYRDDPVHQAGPPSRDEELLAMGAAIDAAHRSFLLTVDGVDVGRVVAIVPPELVHDGARAGLLGYFASIDEPRAISLLVEAACSWLRARGCRHVIGPLNFNTWHAYRFVTEGFENGRFLFEPHHKPGYAPAFAALGFQPLATYASTLIPTLPAPMTTASHGQALAAGIRFEPLEQLAAEGDEALLGFFYDLSSRAFAKKAAFTHISRARFFSLYAGMSALITPGLSHVARDAAGAPLGFVLAIPDFIEPLRSGSDRISTVVVKTLACAPEAPPFLGFALAHVEQTSAREHGYSHAIYALMEKWRPLYRYCKRESDETRVWKRYALLARSLG